MPLIIERLEGETWREAAARTARPHGMEIEVLEEFDACREAGEDERTAAFNACYEWDVCDYVNPRGVVVLPASTRGVETTRLSVEPLPPMRPYMDSSGSVELFDSVEDLSKLAAAFGLCLVLAMTVVAYGLIAVYNVLWGLQ